MYEVKKTTNELHSIMDVLEIYNLAINSGLILHNDTDYADVNTVDAIDDVDYEIVEEIDPMRHFEMDEYVDPIDLSQEYQPCNCLPLCTSLHYDVETSQSHLDLNKYFKANGIKTEDERE